MTTPHGRTAALLGLAVVVALTGWLALHHLVGSSAHATGADGPRVTTVTSGPFSIGLSLKASVTRQDPHDVSTGGRDIEWSVHDGEQVYRGQVLGRSRVSPAAQRLRARLEDARRDRATQRDLAVLELADADRDIRTVRRNLRHVDGPGRTNAEEAVDAARDARRKLVIRLNQDDAESTDAIGTLTRRLAQARQRHRVVAPRTGIFRMVGERPVVTADQYTMTAALAPEEAYRARLLESDSALSGQVRIPAGPTDFTCASVSIAHAGQNSDPARAVCVVPRQVRLVHDLQGTLEVTLWHSDSQLLLDAAAIEDYDPARQIGYVTLAGSSARQRITAGPSDGEQVVVLDGLREGDQVQS